ncbi:unnamed protein product [Zymoseptoria tritici ST99CH_1E4]|uniref:F-box domain-containing protein n=1 Tax=Zymoseptoria tritici ST99CH_1E4 TaxID=1276532 RepID=A0A2H1FX76_ZYMTR|nr:unnamed protein product [Zymoseptoria tritici ST99CH_1E4]
MANQTLLSIPDDLLLELLDHLNIEDFSVLSSTCRTLRNRLGYVSPNTILRLAAKQANVFFRPVPHFLVAATARELGHWARENDSNEKTLASTMERGIEGLMDLALGHCGLTMQRIRELHLLRFSIVNPITDLLDTIVGEKWQSTHNFWEGGVSNPNTMCCEPSQTLFHLAIYGELFGPDFEAILGQDPHTRRLSVDTRLEFIKYCLPDDAAFDHQEEARGVKMPDGSIDPRRAMKMVGPYAEEHHQNGEVWTRYNGNLGVVWVLQSSKWRALWADTRALAGPDFEPGFKDDWWYRKADGKDWRQRMWETVMVCQGLNGLEMIRPDLREKWLPKIREWREQIAKLEEPEFVRVGMQATHEYPYLLGDLRICMSGYCGEHRPSDEDSE